MRLSLPGILVVVGMWHGSALADPGEPPPLGMPCTVTILRAPDRIRGEIEAWVQAERRCRRTLELRVVPTDDGLYVFARDDQGNVRERVVPDDQTIGALVVSWIADDSPIESPIEPAAAPPLPGLPRAEAAIAPAPHAAAVVDDVGSSGAGPSSVETRMTALARPHEWLMLVGTHGVSERRKFGVRAELDLGGDRWWVAGAALGQNEHSQSSMAISMTTLSVYVAAETAERNWQFRVQAGAGLTLYWLRNFCTCEQMGVAARNSELDLRPVTEVSALVGRALGERWSFAVGALVSAMLVDYDLGDQDRASVMVFAGFRNRRDP